MEKTAEPTWSGLEDMRGVLHAFLRRYSPDDNEIDDVIQETFVRAARFRGHAGEPQRLKSWTMRIAANVLADGRRRRARLVGDVDVLPEPPEEPPPDRVGEGPWRLGNWEVDRGEALRQLGLAMHELRGDDRDLLASFYEHGRDCGETAQACGVPRHLVKVRLFRARRRLARLLRRQLACSRGAQYARSAS